jgi:acyl-[acyl carrier protein]--UDP-N-acetylglucosamine O-acyltransferase
VVTKDALPFAKTVGNRARIYGLNTIGLVRRKFSPDAIAKLRARIATCSTPTPAGRWRRSSRIRRCKCPEVQYVVNFIRTSKRGVGPSPARAVALEEVMDE